MRTIALGMGLAAACAAGWAAPAAAAEGRGITGPELARILQDAGYQAKLETDSGGDPMIRTGMDGLNVTVFFYDCKDGRCGSLQFNVGLDLEKGTTLEVVNTFNRGYRYASASLDEENDPFLRFDFEVLHTDHAAHVASQVDIWRDVMAAFTRETGFDDEGADSDGNAAGDDQDTQQG